MGASFSSNKPYMLRAIYEWILDNDATPYILVDATQASVTIPEQYIQNGQIVLNVEPNAIQNWFADNEAISFSARFNGKAMNIFVPMSALLAIYAQENGEGMAFPPEVENKDSDISKDSGVSSVASLDGQSEENYSNVSVDESSGSQKDEKSKKEDAEVININKKKKSHLKVIK